MLTRLLLAVAAMLALLVSAGVAYAQGTPTVPTIESVAVTSDPGEDGGYAIGDEIQVGLTFSEAVTVTGAPQLTLDVGDQRRTAEYSEGSTTTQLLFTYTVASGDEDTDGIAVVANGLALNGGAIRAGSEDATLTHAGLHSGDHKVDGIAPTVTVGGEPRTYVPPGRLFNVIFYFSEKVYGLTTAEITVTNGEAHDVKVLALSTQPRYSLWDVVVLPAAEGPVTVTLAAGVATDAYGNGNAAPDSALEVIAAIPVTVEVARTTSGFAEGGKAEFTVTRSRDNGAIPVSLSVAQTGDFLSGALEVYPPADPNNPDEPVTPQAVTFTQTPFNLNVTFAAGETSKRIALLTEDDFRVEGDGTVTLSVPAQPNQYKYIPGHASSASADVRDNDESATVSLYWSRSSHPYTLATLNTEQEGGSVSLAVYGRATGQPLLVTLAVTEVGSYLDLDGAGAWGYEDLGNGKLQVTVPVGASFQNVVIPLSENDVKEADGSVTITVEPDPGMSYIPTPGFGAITVPVKDNDTPSTVSISAPDDLTEGAQLTYTLTRTWAPGQSRGELPVNVRLAQTGNYITWPAGNEPGDDGLVTIPVTFAARSLTATLTLETVDDEVSEVHGSVTATILADAGGSYVTGADSDHATRLLDNDLPIISITAVATEVTEGTAAQFRLSRMGNTSVATRVGLWVGGLPKIMTDATEATALTADNADLTQRLSVHGAWVDYIVDFAAGESEKTLSFTTEADNVNEGDGWLGVTIVQRLGNRFNIGTGYAQVHVHDDDIPTVSFSQVTLPTGAATLEGDTWVGELGEGQAVSWVVSCSGNYEYPPLRTGSSVSGLRVVAEHLLLANHPSYYRAGIGELLGSNLLNFPSAGLCDGQTRTHASSRRFVGPDGGVETFKLVPNYIEYPIVAEYREAYRQAKAAADAAGTHITQHDIIHPIYVTPPHSLVQPCYDEPRYCPQYRVGTPHKISLTLVNRNPTILIKAESTPVEEGQAARFIVERLWHDELLRINGSPSVTVVALRASQNGQYITGALPTEITFARTETSKIIELATVDDSAFGANGSVTIQLLPDTTGADLNAGGKYETFANWAGHTPEGARSDRATVAITNNDTKPGITIAPASGPEGDSGSADMTFTVTLATAVTEAVTVNYATSDGTAIAGQDYTAVSDGSVTIGAGKTTAEFTVSMTGDETDELDETFNVTISMPEPEPNLNGGGSGEPAAAITGGDTATVAGTILDDDPAVVTVAPKVDTVEEGKTMAVFVLTRAGVMDGPLAIQVRLRAPGRLETLDARFEPGAATAEIAVATHDNDLVDYPSVRDYTIEVFGDGAPLDRDDRIFTPGDPATATVKVTDDEELINVTVYPVEAVASWANGAEFRFTRDGDITDPLRIGIWSFVHRPGEGETWGFRFETFEAGQDELVVGQGGFYYPDMTPQLAATLYPLTLTYTVFGDGGWYGLNRVYQGGDPSSAIVAVQYEGFERALVVGSDAPLWVTVGQTVRIPLTVTNTGSLDSLTSIDITSQHYSDGTNEPRLACQIDGPIADGESKSCEASFLVQETDLKSNNAIIRLDVTASDGQTTSKASRVYMRVRNGVSIGFTESANLAVTEPSFGEANAEAALTVTRVGQSGEEVQVAYTLEPSASKNRPYPPVEGVDYADNSDSPGVITFAKNETEKTITIDILGDRIDEAREQFRVTLVPPEGVLVEEDKKYRTVVINDATPPPGVSYRPKATLELVSSGPVPESEGPVEFAVVLDREWGIDSRYEVELLPDQLTATPGTARLGIEGDFEAPPVLFLRIPAGQTRFEFSVPLYDDDVREEDETFQLLLSSSLGNFYATIGTPKRALATIADDDRIPPTEVVLSLSRHGGALTSVDEGASRRDITVTASFPRIHWPGDASDAPLRPADPRDVDTTVRVQFDPNSGATQAAGLDDFEPFKVEDDQGAFGGVESFDIVIPAGQTSATATLRFKTVKDDVDEEDETVTLMGSELVAGGSADFLPVRSASFTIIDDDTRGITVSPAKLAAGTGISMKEGGTSTYSLVLDSEPTDTVTVTVAGRQGDLISLTPETLTFTPSDWSTAKTISVVSLDDGTDTSFTNAVISHEVSGGDYGSVTVREIWVQIENTTQAYIYLDDAQASESDGHLEFTVSVRPMLRTTPVLVRYATVDGTARAGSDYTRQVETGQTYKIFTIPANRDTGTIRIPIADNQVYGPAKKTFTLQLTNHNNKATLDGDATSLTATGAIADDDPKPVVSVAGPAGAVSYVSESAKDPITFTLTLVGQSAGDVAVDYATGEARLLGLLTARQGLAGATRDEDYVGTSGTVTFTPGQTTKTVTVPVTNDDVSEETEFFGFTISAPQGADLRGQRSEDVADVGLLDDDPRGVTIALTSVGLDEPASGETAVAGSYTVNLNSRPTATVTVTIGGTDPAVSLSGNTLTNNQLTFTTTNWNTAQLVTVTPVKDDNAVGETITLTHTPSGGDYTGIAADSVTVNLTDSDTRNLVLSGQSLTVTEEDATGVGYTVKLATQPSDTVTVTISGHDGADLTLSGTTLTSNQLTFTTTNWGTAQTVIVKAGDDDNTDDESETLAHTAFGGDYVNVTRDLPVTITDDDVPAVTVQFEQGAYPVAEGDMVTVTVTLSADPERTVEIELTATNQGGASSPADYTGVPASVTFNAGDTEQTFVFTAAQDSEDDDGERVRLSFGAMPDARVNAGTTATTTVSITDDDPPTAANGTVTTNEDTPYAFAAARFGYTDIDGDALSSVKITALPTAGTLKLDGTPIASGALPKTVAAADLAAGKLTYTPPANANGRGYASFTFKVNDGTADSAQYTMTIDVTAVNDAATAANGTVTTNEDTDYTFSAAEFSYADTDNDALSSVKITGLPTAGTLKLDGTPIASGVLPKTVAAADVAAGKLTYTPPANANKTAYASFTFKVNDGTVDSAQYTMTIDVTAVNDAATAANGTVTTNEDTDYTFSAAEFSYADTDNDALSSVKITGLPTAGTLKLDGTPIASGVLPKTVAAADVAAGKLTYTPPANANKTAYASFTFKVNDGTVDSAQYTMTIDVTAVNDAATGAPTISGTAEVGQTLTASTVDISDVDGVPNSFTYQWKRYAANGTTFEANIGGDARTYTLTESEEGKKVKVDVRFRDNGGSPEGPLLSAAYPASLSETVGARPVLNTLPTAANGTVTTNEDTPYAFAAARFGYAGDDGDALSSVKITGLPTAGTLKLDGTPIASGALPKAVAAADLAAGKLTYTPPANANGRGYASFTFKVNDGTVDSAQYTMTIDVTAVNDAATAANGTVTTKEDTDYTFSAAEFSYADIDSDALSSVKITGLPTAGTLKLDGTPIASGALPKAVAAADVAAGKLTYTPPPNANKTAYASFTFKVNDGTVDSAQYTMTIDVTAVNDAATGAPTISGTAEVGQTLTASTAEISDVDGVPNSFTYQWKRYAANGTTFEANIGADARTYTLTESEEGKKVKVDVRFRDNGGSPEGPLLSAAYPASLSETVGARPVLNTLPTASNGTVTTDEDAQYAFSAAEFGYADNDGDALSSVKITGLPTAGTLKLDGTPIASGALPKTVAAADVAAGKLTYTPPPNANKTAYASFTFKVNDGTADSAQYTMTIDVTAVNDAATAANGTVTTNEDTDYTFSAAEFSYADTDNDALSSVKITGLPTAGTLKLDGTPIASGVLPKTVAAADVAAGKLTYTPPPNANKTAYTSFTFKVNDGTVDSAQYTMTIDVTAVNDAATGAPTISGTAEVGQTLTASTAGITDVDGVPNSFTYQWKRYAANGTTFEANIGGDARTYTLTESEEGKKVKVDVRFRDNGGSPEGPLLSAAYPASLSETVGARPVVNTLPTAANGTVTTKEDTDYTFLAAEFGYADDDGDALSSVKITALPTAGTLKLDGTTIASGALPKTVAAADLAAGKLTYTPPANANKTAYASFTFKVNDGTADSAQYTMTIDVTAVNDAATGAPTISGTAYVGETLTASAAGITDVEGVPGSLNYQWIQVGDDGTSNPTDIGADASTYTLTEADFSKRIKVRVDFIDGQGSAESRTSAAYPANGTVQRMTVQFQESAYSVAEGDMVMVTVTLNVAAQHVMDIPIAKENLGGAGSTDYSGVPPSVTFNAGDTSKSFEFTAARDSADDDGESVKVKFGSSLPLGVSPGARAETVVSIASRAAQQLSGNVGQSGTVVTITQVPDGTVEDGSTFVEGTRALFRLEFEAVGGGPSTGGVDVDLSFDWQNVSPLVNGQGQATKATISLPRVDVWDTWVQIRDNDVGQPDETMTIRITGCERNGCIVGTPSALTLTITDDDGGTATAVPGPADAPRLVCARSGGGYDDTGIAVSWKAPNFVGGAPVESYELRYRESSKFIGGSLIEHLWESWPHGVAATSATITGLATRVDYTVQVQAVSANGPGRWSEPDYFKVGPMHEICEIIDQLTPP